MEEEPNPEPPFLKIGSIWSESEQEFCDLTIKEENISDVETENINDLHPDNDGPSHEAVTKQNITESSKEINNEKDRKKKTGENLKINCLHDGKNFKVLKKRLRCSDCNSILCPECFSAVNSLQSHFSKSDNNNKSLYPCKLCSMIFKSNCALQAHIRIHLLDTPYVCPDCGLVYNNMYFLSLHLINTCYHVYKVITNGCKFCFNKNMPAEEFLAHIKKSHIHSVYKCSLCFLVYGSPAEITRHLGTNHKNENALCLSCFSCSMCGDEAIDEKLYEKHIKYHLEHTVAFQIGYLCSCGHGFRTASSFRSHFRNCSKRGILPPQWTYLQVTLKTHEMKRIQKNALKDSESALMSISDELKNGSDARKYGFSLFEDSNSSDVDEPNEGTLWNRKKLSFEKSKTYEGKKTVIEKTKKQGRKSLCSPEKSDKSISEVNVDKPMKEGVTNVIVDNAVELSSETALDSGQVGNNVDISPDVPVSEELTVAALDENVIGQTQVPKDCSEKISDQNLKIAYDHIPCDHLGYLKTQQSSGIKTERNSDIGCDLGENVPGSERVTLMSVLDEKTGLMRTKEVAIPQNRENENGSPIDSSLPGGIQCQEIQRLQSVSTIFSCPFCTVLFPKHFSTFQRFRLHLEFYHPDASLDITVDRTQTPKSQAKYTTISVSGDSDDELDDIDLQTRLDLSLKEAHHYADGSRVADTETQFSDKKKDGSPREKQSVKKELKKNQWNQKMNEDNRIVAKSTDEKNQLKEHEFLLVNLQCNEDIGDESVDSEFGSNRTVRSRRSDDGDKPKKSLLKRRLSDLSKDRRISEDSLSDDNFCDRMQRSNSDQDGLSSKNYWLRRGKMLEKSHGEGDQEGDCDKSGSTKDDLSPRGRCMERRTSRRESDVWSEFYKTLKIAETFKKTKTKKEEKNGEKETPILTNYTNKRVVKKPKRYRESSDSEGSNEDEKHSPGDSRHFDSRLDMEDDDLYIKKKRLMNRLENLDYRLLDYVFKILERKQKNNSILKKNSDGVKNCKKKVMNGVKGTGRQKTGAENVEDIEISINLGDRDFSDYNYEDLESEFSLSDEKLLEKRRGRPRKNDMMKDRRRSDGIREGFTEKAFDADESDFLTSKKKRKLTKVQYCKKLQAEKNEFSSGQVISTKTTDTEKKLVCAVCKETYQNETEFREHIQVHKDDDNNHQCLECGECFVVRPSLEKHLHAFHKIKDVQKYIEVNDYPPPEKNEEDTEPLKENQCKVCRDQFDNPHDLSKHFRIHGMAFLRQYRKENKAN